jgi:hypothetical protein
MTLPDNFSEFEHLQSTFIRVHNRQVRLAFSDLGGDSWNPDINSPRGSLRHACTIKDNDTADMIVMRYLLFYMSLGRIGELIEPFYGIPVDDYQQNVRFKPQISLHFKEDEEDVDSDYSPLRMKVSIRLIAETSTSLTQAKLLNLANKIKTEFAASNGYRFHKGKELWTYKEPEKGYNLQIYAFSETEARELISKILSIQTDTISNRYLIGHINEGQSEAYPINPGTQSILGKVQKKARLRPVGYVRFQYALIHIHNLPNPVPLVDRTYRFLDPIVNA